MAKSIIIILRARMGPSRMPGKVLKLFGRVVKRDLIIDGIFRRESFQ
jgi:hypothetical protein